MKQIAYLTSMYPRATDTFIRTEVKALRDIGYKVKTFSIRRPSSDHLVGDEIRKEYKETQYLFDSNGLQLLTAFGIILFSKPVRLLSTIKLAFQTGSKGIAPRIKQVAYILEASLLARKLIKSNIQHLHNHIGENSATVAMLASRLSEIPYSLTIHGPGIFFHPRQWALGEKIKRSTFTACISSFCRSQCMIFTPHESWDKLHIIHCGLDNSYFKKRNERLPDKPKFICIGRLCPEKGQLLLVEAVKQLKEEGYIIEIELIGDGETRQDIETAIEKGSLQNQISITGWLDSNAVREKLLDSWGLVVASFAEGLPVVVMESLAMGRPVISTNVAGIPELVEDGINGFLIPPSSISQLKNALRKIASLPIEDLHDMGQAGAEKTFKKHNINIEVTKLDRLFKKYINSYSE